MSEEQKARELYLNPATGFASLPEMWRRAKKAGNKISLNDLKKLIEATETYQIHKEAKKPKEYANVYASAPLECVQLDIMIYSRFALHKYTYILGVIDVYS